LFPKLKHKRAHGGSHSVGKRREARPLNLKLSHHITMKSHHAFGARSLFRHKKLILGLIKKNAYRFQVKVFEYAIQGNHLHLLVKSQTREGLQNFFRVVAGHSAQKILQIYPLKLQAGGAPDEKKGCSKNRRKFWSFLLYSRVVSWGREFKTVVQYIQRNTLELFNLIAYQPRLKRKKANSS
jgi:REP element-mobilizing transposase RayT